VTRPKRPQDRKPLGRPCGTAAHLDPETLANIVDLMHAKGVPPRTAAIACGVPSSTHHRYYELGLNEGADCRNYRRYRETLEKARAMVASRFYDTIRQAAMGWEEPVVNSKGEAVTYVDEKGRVIVVMRKRPGEWTAAARALEALVGDEFARGAPGGGGAEGETIGGLGFDIVMIGSDRDEGEAKELEAAVRKRAARESARAT